MQKTDSKEWITVGKGRLKPNKRSTHNLAPNFVGSMVFDTEYLQKQIDKGYGRVMLPLSMWLKDSQFNDEQYVDIQVSSLTADSTEE